jgi:seven-transmembrane receptor
MGGNEALSTLTFLCGTLPSAFTQAAFYSWIIRALQDTRETLSTRKQFIKKAMFDRLSRMLTGFFLASIVMSIASALVFVTRVGDPSWFSRHWHSLWLYIDGWPIILNFVASIAVAYIWRPRMNNRDYALQQLPSDFQPSSILTIPHGKPNEVPLKERMPDSHPQYDEHNEYRGLGREEPASDDTYGPGRGEILPDWVNRSV